MGISCPRVFWDEQYTYQYYIEASPCSLYDDCSSWFVQFHSPTNLRTPLLHGGREWADVFITKLCRWQKVASFPTSPTPEHITKMVVVVASAYAQTWLHLIALSDPAHHLRTRCDQNWAQVEYRNEPMAKDGMESGNKTNNIFLNNLKNGLRINLWECKLYPPLSTQEMAQ